MKKRYVIIGILICIIALLGYLQCGREVQAVNTMVSTSDTFYKQEFDVIANKLFNLDVDQHIIIWHFRRIKLCRNNAGIFHPRTPGILVITVIEKIITVITRLKMGYFNFPDSANYGIK